MATQSFRSLLHRSAPWATLALLVYTWLGGLHQQPTQSPQAPNSAELKALAQRIESIESYLQAQAQAGKQVDAALDQAVTQGFVAGINHNSRRTLVAAWRKRNAALRAGLPGSPVPALEK